MLDTVRSFFSSHRDASDSVKQAEKFSVRLPFVGRVGVPPPDQLAFFGVLGVLAAAGAIEWPVAVTIGVGQVVLSRQLGDSKPAAEPDSADTELDDSAPPALPSAEPEPSETPAKKAPAKKTPAKKAPAKKAPAKKATAAKKNASTAEKSTSKKAAPRKFSAKKRTT